MASAEDHHRVTALFADISGFTTLADRLDPDTLHEIIGPVISALAAVAERRGGVIAKFAGDALLVLFGVPEPRPDDPARALRTALEMHGELAAVLPDLPREASGLELHVGVEAGTMAGSSTDERSILGDAVTLAQGLEAVTPGGQTSVGPVVHDLVGDDFDLEPLGEVEVRGSPLPVWRLVGAEPEADLDATTEGFLRGLAEATAPLEVGAGDERRLVTAVFANFVGLPSVAEEAGPEQVPDIVAPIISRLAEVAERYEAFVARYAADALLAFFGAPVAHEDDPARALLAAQEMHRQFERMRPQLPAAAAGMALHIGVNSGHVISGEFGGEIRADYSILGDAVNTAQRLQSVAPPGKTYVGELTYRLTHERFELEQVGELRLKGKDRPVLAWSVVGERKVTDGGSLRTGRPAPPLFGRSAEVETIAAVLDGLGESRRGVVCLTGEPGVGKSRLTRELRERAERRGARWMDARCISYGRGLAYWPYADLVRRAFGVGIEDRPGDAARRLAEATLADGVPEATPFFARLVGVPVGPGGERVMELEPEAFRRGLHDAFRSWIEGISRQAPVILAIEDMHWADASSLDLTQDLIGLSGHAPVVLYLTGRPEAEPALREMGGGAPEGRSATIALGPLDAHALSSLVGWTLSGDPPADLVEAVVERAGGNPFFVEEMIRALQEEGALFESEGRWRLRPGRPADALPATVEGVLSARIDMLPREAADVLQTAAVVGRRVRIQLLEAVSEDGSGLDRALERLVESGFLDPMGATGGGDLYFHHALAQEVAYSRLVRRRRRTLHLRVAEAGERLYGSGDDVVDLLARHYYLADAGPRALDYLVRAGHRARRLFANEEAIVHLSRAAEVSRAHPDQGGRLQEILLELADVNDLRGRYQEALELYHEVRAATNDVFAWRGAAAILRKRGQYDEALGLVDVAFGACQVPSSQQAPLWLERGWTLGLAGRYAEGIEAMRHGLDALPQRDDPIAAELLLQLARSEIVEGRLDDALAHATEAKGILEGLDDLRGLAKALRIVGDVYTHQGQLQEAAATLGRGLEIAERVGSVDEIGGTLINLGLVELKRGNLEEAVASDRRAVEEFEQVGHEFGRSTAYANLAEKLMLQGNLDEALTYCEKALELGRRIGYTMTVADATMTLASIRLRQAELPEAVDRAEEAAKLFLEMSAPAFAAEALEIAASALQQAGDEERARRTLDRARSLAPA